MNRYIIRSIALTPESLLVEYVEVKADLRENGLALNHVLHIPRDEEYVEGIELLEAAAGAVLQDALDDFHLLPPADPEEDIRREKARLAHQVGADEDDDTEPTLEFE